MKKQYWIFYLTSFFLFCASSHAEKLVFPFLKMEGQSNIIVLADMDHHLPCPQKYTNLFSNTNLFTLTEQEKLRNVALKYQKVTTNSGPAGSVFSNWELRRMKYTELGVATNIFLVACFNYTNCNAREEIYAYSGSKNIIAKFRTSTGDGYDVCLINNTLTVYQEYKNEVLDGLLVGVHDPNHLDDKVHCGMWTRFTKGKVFGKFITWGQDDFESQAGFEIGAEAEFKEPFDFLKYQSIPIVLAWIEVLTNAVNSDPNTK